MFDQCRHLRTTRVVLLTVLFWQRVYGDGLDIVTGDSSYLQEGADFDGYFSDWTSMGNRPTQPTCVEIPKNMSLCHNIGYNKMRLPNLLDHDTLSEALAQAQPWNSLLNINCHLDTQLFLCSLFSPVCLDRPIYPCRSLCEKVKSGCEARMGKYGYPWPEMFRCDKFPLDNDMCISPQSTKNDGSIEKSKDTSACSACRQIQTYENILDNFCRADFALKTKIKKIKKSRIVCKKSKVFKRGKNLDEKDARLIRRPKFDLDNMDECCGTVGKKAKSHYLIMGQKIGTNLTPTFIMEWSRDSVAFKKAVRKFKGLDCSNPKIVSESMVAVDGTLKVDTPFLSKGSSVDKGPAIQSSIGRNTRKARGRKGKKDNLFSTANSNVTLIGFHSDRSMS